MGDGQRLPGWMDSGDSYVCACCRYEVGNPNKLPGGPWTCPRCGADMTARRPLTGGMTMSDGYSSKRFKCPFFRWDEKGKVHCEGGVVSLPRPELRRYVEQYCANLQGWKQCPMARGMGEYYDRQSGE